jgi:23S rRNA (cytidine1920-2'-O)/16S rRNA (cytidine1409-2'-O)-methyltransferase
LKKTRLDILLVERGLVESREAGRRLIMAGEVLVDDRPATKPGTSVRLMSIFVLSQKPRFVSRGARNLAAALARFDDRSGRLGVRDVASTVASPIVSSRARPGSMPSTWVGSCLVAAGR